MRQKTLCLPDIDQRRHGLQFLFAEETEESTDVDKVDEAGVQLLVGVYVPEWIKPVAVVEMCIATHHLAVDRLRILLKLLRESGSLAQPLPSSELCKRCIKVRWSRGDWSAVSGRWRIRRRSRAGVDWEKMRVANFANDPFLNKLDVLRCWNFDRPLLVV